MVVILGLISLHLMRITRALLLYTMLQNACSMKGMVKALPLFVQLGEMFENDTHCHPPRPVLQATGIRILLLLVVVASELN